MYHPYESFSFELLTTSGSCNHSSSSLAYIPELREEEFHIHTPFMAEGSETSRSLHVVSCKCLLEEAAPLMRAK